MTIVAVLGQRCTTTAVGLAAALPAVEPAGEAPLLVEADPAGGYLSAWFALTRRPGLLDLVAAAGNLGEFGLDECVQSSERGVEVIVGPHRGVEAAAALAAAGTVLAQLRALSRTAVIDGGRWSATTIPPVALGAQAVVLSHCQHPASAAAAAVGWERLAEACAAFQSRSMPVVVAVHGTTPYRTTDVAGFLGVDAVCSIADDPWAAAVIAGRPGSPRKLRRSAWWSSMTRLATAVRGG